MTIVLDPTQLNEVRRLGGGSNPRYDLMYAYIYNQFSIFNQLRVWKDTNQDGISQSTELYSLAELSIRSINLEATAQRVTDSNNVVHTNLGSYTQASSGDGVDAAI